LSLPSISLQVLSRKAFLSLFKVKVLWDTWTAGTFFSRKKHQLLYLEI
jgi:hypothetical protein